MAGRGPAAPPKKAPAGRIGFGSERNPCEQPIKTFLSNVRMKPAAALAEGDILDVKLLSQRGRQTVVCTSRSDGEIVGVVLSRGAARLIDCMSQGFQYAATVIEADYGSVEVVIRSVS